MLSVPNYRWISRGVIVFALMTLLVSLVMGGSVAMAPAGNDICPARWAATQVTLNDDDKVTNTLPRTTGGRVEVALDPTKTAISLAFGEQVAPAVAYDPDHDQYLVVWEDWRNDDGSRTNADVYGRLLGRDGTPVSSEFVITDAPGNQTRPAVAYGGAVPSFHYDLWDYVYLVVWEDERPGATSERDVYGQWVVVDDMLSGWGFEIAMSPGNQVAPAVACTGLEGNCLVVWSDEGVGEFDPDVYGRVTGWIQAWPPPAPFPISTAAYIQSWPTITYNAVDGEYLVAWWDSRHFANAIEIYLYGQRVSSAGALLDNPDTPGDETDPTVNFQISTTGWDSYPSVAHNPAADKYLVAWSWGDLGDVYGQLVDAEGALVGDNFAISDRENIQWLGQATYDAAANQYLVVWEDSPIIEGDYDVYLRRVAPEGVPLDAEEPVTVTNGDQWQPTVACGGGTCLVVWQDEQRAALSGTDIYGIPYIPPTDSCPSGWRISNVRLNGDGPVLRVEPGAQVEVALDYEIGNTTACPYCIDQLVIGMEDQPAYCAYDGVPSVWPDSTTGTSIRTITAPTMPGTHRLMAFDACQYNCPDAMALYPTGHRLSIGTVIVGSSAQVWPEIGPPGTAVTISGYTRPGAYGVYALLGSSLLGTASINFDGSYAIDAIIPEGADPGDHEICVKSWWWDFERSEIEPVGCVVFTVEPLPPGYVAGTITDGVSGLEGVEVWLETLDATSMVSTTTAATGTYTLTVHAGDYMLWAYKRGYDPESSAVSVRPAFTTTIDLQLEEVEEAPQVIRVTAAIDGLAGDDVGAFVSLPNPGLPVTNTFSAEAVGLRNNLPITQVRFTLYGLTKTDTTSADGWSATFDMSMLPPGTATLTVIAYDDLGPGPAKQVAIHVLPPPPWFGKDWVWDSQVAWSPGEHTYTFTGIVPNNPRLYYERNVNLPYLDGLRNHFESDIHLTDVFGISGDWTFTAEGVLKATVLDQDLLDQHYPITIQLDAERQVATYRFGPEIFQLTKFAVPVYDGVVLSLWGIVNVGVSVDFGFHATLTVQGQLSTAAIVDSARLTPYVEPSLAVSVWVDILWGVAKGGATVTGSLDYRLPIVYAYTHDPRLYLDDDCLHFLLEGHVWAKVKLWLLKKKWKWGPKTLYEWSDPQGCHLDGRSAALQALPDLTDQLFAAPSVAADDDGHVLAVWIQDQDPTVEGEDPELVYTTWDGRRWSEPALMATNDRWETDPQVAFVGPNRALAVWTQFEALPTRASATGQEDDLDEFNTTLSEQEIFAAFWDGETWGEPYRITHDARPDGLAAVAADPVSQIALVAWVQDGDGRIETRGDWDIYYAIWYGGEASFWTDPAPLAADPNAAEFEVALAFDATGRAIATWVRDDDAYFTTNCDRQVVHAFWDPQTGWGPPIRPSQWPTGALMPDVAFDQWNQPIFVFTALGTLPSGAPAGIGDKAFLWSAWPYYEDGWAVTPIGENTPAEWPQVEVNDQNQAIVVFRHISGAETALSGEVAAAVADLGQVGQAQASASQPMLEWSQPVDLTSDEAIDWQTAFAVDSAGRVHILAVKETPDGDIPAALIGQTQVLDQPQGLYSLTLPDRPDLVISQADVAFSNDHPAPGETVTITTTLHNLGIAPVVPWTDFVVRFFLGDPSDPDSQIGEVPVSAALPFGGQVQVAVPWTATCGLHNVTVAVDPQNRVLEVREDNNASESKIGQTPAPRLLKATEDPYQSAMHLRWTAPEATSIVRYQIYRSTVSGADYRPVGATGATEFVDTSAVPGTTYYYVVTAVNPCDVESLPSNETVVALREEKALQTQKVEVTIEIQRIHLDYAGDSAEGFLGIATRGHDGEVMLGSWGDWMPGEITHKDPGKKGQPPGLDGNNPQIRVLGPINDFPNGGTQGFAKGGTVYHQKADCPVEKAINVYWTLWDDDSSQTARGIMNAIVNAIAAKAAKQGGAWGKGDLEKFIGKLIEDGDDTPLGVYSALIDIGDPCEKPKGAVLDQTTRVDLKNTTPSWVWSGGYPDTNGWLEYKIKIRHLEQKSSVVTAGPAADSNYTNLVGVDLGQLDEAILSVTAWVASPIPQEPLNLAYRLLLNTDDNPATGATAFPEMGADYELRLAFEDSIVPVGRLLRWDSLSARFEEVPGGIYDFALDTARQVMSLDVELARLGNPSGFITAWGVVQQGSSVLDVLPDNPETMPVAAITPNYVFSGTEPYVVLVAPAPDQLDVPRSATTEVEFSKAMARATVEPAFSMSPSVEGSFSWQGDRLIFTPAAPLASLTQYTVTIGDGATDRVGTALDGDGDGLPGGTFTWSFWTKGLPLFASDASGNEKRLFRVGESIHVTGESFPPNMEFKVYMIAHPRLGSSEGIPLIDLSGDSAPTVSTNSNGVITPTLLSGWAPFAGEFNIVADVNGNGQLDLAQDRIDRLGIGFGVGFAQVSASIPLTGGSLTSSFDQTIYTFAADTFTDTVTITHTARPSNYVPSTASLAGIGHFFKVSAVYSSTGHPAQPTRPYTVTVGYTEAEKGPAIESTLALYNWDGSQWVKEPTSVVDTVNNTVTGTPEHFSLWAVLGETRRVFLPIVLRNY